MYWVYETKIYTWRNQYVQAKLIQPPPRDLVHLYGPHGFRYPMQDEPYGVYPDLVYQINPKHPHPDNYIDSAGFNLYSSRLIALMKSFGVHAEVFPVTMADKSGNPQPHLDYSVFHVLEGVKDAMDEEQSGWSGDFREGIPRLVLNYSKFEHRPVFLCNHVYVPLMRDDLKTAIVNKGITGFAFLSPDRYRSGRYGFPPDFDT